jgi:methylmalonyl-CoA/ethylmalonyl-CoA epimerase
MEPFIFHHVGIAVQEIQKAVTHYRDLFGYKLTAGPFDDPIQKVSVCFLSRGGGDTVVELVAPLGPDSPVIRTLKKGGSVYHVCYEVTDIEASIKHLTDRGSLLLRGPDPAVAFNHREIAWLMTETNLLVELLQT